MVPQGQTSLGAREQAPTLLDPRSTPQQLQSPSPQPPSLSAVLPSKHEGPCVGPDPVSPVCRWSRRHCQDVSWQQRYAQHRWVHLCRSLLLTLRQHLALSRTCCAVAVLSYATFRWLLTTCLLLRSYEQCRASPSSRSAACTGLRQVDSFRGGGRRNPEPRNDIFGLSQGNRFASCRLQQL